MYASAMQRCTNTTLYCDWLRSVAARETEGFLCSAVAVQVLMLHALAPQIKSKSDELQRCTPGFSFLVRLCIRVSEAGVYNRQKATNRHKERRRDRRCDKDIQY